MPMLQISSQKLILHLYTLYLHILSFKANDFRLNSYFSFQLLQVNLDYFSL
jgi:hypothetical protein